jgi:hypothetical protein
MIRDFRHFSMLSIKKRMDSWAFINYCYGTKYRVFYLFVCSQNPNKFRQIEIKCTFECLQKYGHKFGQKVWTKLIDGIFDKLPLSIIIFGIDILFTKMVLKEMIFRSEESIAWEVSIHSFNYYFFYENKDLLMTICLTAIKQRTGKWRRVRKLSISCRQFRFWPKQKDRNRISIQWKCGQNISQ